MERIKASDLNALMRPQQEAKQMTTPSPVSLERDMAITRWLRFAARHYKETVTEEDVRMWIQSLSSFPREAIENAFSDYINYELDEFGRAWMPKIPQIRQRCVDWCERNSGPPASDLSAEMTKWREEEKQNQQDPEWLMAYQGLKSHLRRLWPGSGGNESETKNSCKQSDEESQKNSTTND